MTQHPTTNGGSDGTSTLAQAVQDVTTQAQHLVREEVELAKAEVTLKAKSLAKGAAVGAAAGVFALGALLLLLHGLAWLAWYLLFGDDPTYFWGYFVVAGVLLLLGAIAGMLAAKAFKKGSPPTPQMAIDEAQRIRATVQHPEEATR